VKLPRFVDRQFVSSLLLTIAFYGTLIVLLVSASWWLGNWAAVAFFAFMIWAYRWAIGAALGLCARRPGARRESDEGARRDATLTSPRS
jgi:hypothetical protein